MEDQSLEYVGFWPRVWASIIDIFLSSVILVPLVSFFEPNSFGWSIDSGIDGLDIIATHHSLRYYLLNYLLPAVAVIAFWLSRQATPGKMAIRAKVVDARTGGPLSPGQAVIRYVGYYVSLFPFGLGIFWVGFDARKQGWHDKLAGTVVVRPKQRGPEPVDFKPR